MSCYSQYFASQASSLMSGNISVSVKCMYNQAGLAALTTCTKNDDCNMNGVTGMCCATRNVTFNMMMQTGAQANQCLSTSMSPMTVGFGYPNNTNTAQVALACMSSSSTGGFAVAGKMLSAVVLALFSFFYF